MYTRSYYPEGEGIKIPENYDGNAFREIGTKEEERIAPSEDIEKIRRAMLGFEKISLTDAAKILNTYKKRK